MIPNIFMPLIESKSEKRWKLQKSREGIAIKLPTRLRLVPNKYSPGNGKVIKNPPYCYNHREEKSVCKSCMWRFGCISSDERPIEGKTSFGRNM